MAAAGYDTVTTTECTMRSDNGNIGVKHEHESNGECGKGHKMKTRQKRSMFVTLAEKTSQSTSHFEIATGVTSLSAGLAK